MDIQDAPPLQLPDLKPPKEKSLQEIEEVLAKKIRHLCPVSTEGKWYSVPWHGRNICLDPKCSTPHDPPPNGWPFAVTRPDTNTIIVTTKDSLIAEGGFSKVCSLETTQLRRRRILPLRGYRKQPSKDSYVHFAERQPGKTRDPDQLERILKIQQQAFDVKGPTGNVAPPPKPVDNGDYIQPNLGNDFLNILKDGSIPKDGGKSVPLTFDLRLEMLLQALMAIGQCHQAGIYHRDIKMENFTAKVTKKGQLKVHLIDFGDAITKEEATQKSFFSIREFTDTCTQNGMQPTVATDIYAMGCLIAEMLPIAYDQHYCRGYLLKGDGYFVEQMRLQMEALKRMHPNSLAEQNAINSCLALVHKIIIADQRLLSLVLHRCLPYALIIDKTNPQYILNNPKNYKILAPLITNERHRRINLKPEVLPEKLDNKITDALQYFCVHSIEGKQQYIQPHLLEYVNQAEALYPSLNFLYVHLENILIEYQSRPPLP